MQWGILHDERAMIRGYVRLMASFPGILAYGCILLIISSLGQTYFISLFNEKIVQEFALSNSEFGSLYAVATFASAAAMPVIGRWIDNTPIRTFTFSVGMLLAVASFLLACASNLYVLGFSLFLLRLSGLGLIVHTAVTATLRAFPRDSGKALAIVDLGYSLALIVVPLVAALGLERFGWRVSWFVASTLAIIAAVVTYTLAPAQHPEPLRNGRPDERGVGAPKRPRWSRVILLYPVMLTVSFVLTGLLFYQARLATEKGWPLAWLAGCFGAFAVAQAITSIFAGAMIDKVGSLRLVPIFLTPLIVGLALVGFFNSPWMAPVYLALLGVSAAIDSKLGTTLWVDLFGLQYIGTTRSLFEGVRIVTTGAAPLVMGLFLDLGISITNQIIVCLLYAVAVSFLSLPIVLPIIRLSACRQTG